MPVMHIFICLLLVDRFVSFAAQHIEIVKRRGHIFFNEEGTHFLQNVGLTFFKLGHPAARRDIIGLRKGLFTNFVLAQIFGDIGLVAQSQHIFRIVGQRDVGNGQRLFLAPEIGQGKALVDQRRSWSKVPGPVARSRRRP